MKANSLPLISVIIPVHNPGIYFNACLESVRHQTFKNLEIIIINDDSTDGSESTIEQYKKIDNRAKSYFTRHHNAALTRREGIKHSSGQYVCFVDSDDVVSSDYVKVLYDAVVVTGAEIATAKMSVFFQDKDVGRQNADTNKVHAERDTLAFFCGNYHLSKEGSYIAQSMAAKIFSRQSLKDINYNVIKSPVLEDNFITPQILSNLKPQKLALVDTTVYFYRQHQESTMSGVLTRKIPYGKEELTYPTLFEKTIDYIRSLYTEHENPEKYLNQLRGEEYFEITTSLTSHTFLLAEQNHQLLEEQKRYREENIRLRQNIENDAKILNDLLNSKAYRIGNLMVKPARIIQAKIKK